jgi:uncharacterized membrane protein (DUF2068 family)
MQDWLTDSLGPALALGVLNTVAWGRWSSGRWALYFVCSVVLASALYVVDNVHL